MLIAALKSALDSCPHSTHLNASCVLRLSSSMQPHTERFQYVFSQDFREKKNVECQSFSHQKMTSQKSLSTILVVPYIPQ